MTDCTIIPITCTDSPPDDFEVRSAALITESGWASNAESTDFNVALSSVGRWKLNKVRCTYCPAVRSFVYVPEHYVSGEDPFMELDMRVKSDDRSVDDTDSLIMKHVMPSLPPSSNSIEYFGFAASLGSTFLAFPRDISAGSGRASHHHAHSAATVWARGAGNAWAAIPVCPIGAAGSGWTAHDYTHPAATICASGAGRSRAGRSRAYAGPGQLRWGLQAGAKRDLPLQHGQGVCRACHELGAILSAAQRS